MASDQLLRGFLVLDPLILDQWTSGGEAQCIAWCRSNMHIRTHQFSVVTAALLDEHWMPIWLSPSDHGLQVHIIVDDVHAGTVPFAPAIETIQRTLST